VQSNGKNGSIYNPNGKKDGKTIRNQNKLTQKFPLMEVQSVESGHQIDSKQE